jgi:hypothetical protein
MIIKEKISKEKLKEIIGDADMAKLAVDVMRKVLAIGCEFHVYCAEELLKDGSHRKNIWGANVYAGGVIDFTAVFNIRPEDGNRSMEIQDENIRGEVESVIKKLLSV